MLKHRLLPLLLILLFSAYLRMGVGLKWDEGQMLHPDERFLTSVASEVRLPHSLGEYLDSKRNPLSPYNHGQHYYVYGNLPLTITRVGAELVGMTDYDSIYLVGRVLSGIFDLIAIAAVYFLGAALYSHGVGLLASLFLALSVQNIQLSHFTGTENYVGAFVTLCALFLVYAGHAYRDGFVGKARLHLAISGLMLGCGLASKISAVFFLPIAASVILGGLYLLVDDYLNRIKLQSVFIELGIGALGIFLVATLVAFRLGHPAAFEGTSWIQLSSQFVENMKQIKEVTDGGEWPPNVQWAGRTPVLFTLQQMLHWEQGYGFFIASFCGLLFAAYELVRRKMFKHYIAVGWVCLFLVYQSTRFVTYGRYLSIVYPFLALLAGYFIASVFSQRKPFNGIPLLRLGGLSLIIAAAWWALAFTSIYHYPHTRLAASRWIFENVPTGSVILNEAWDDGLPMRVDGKDGFGGMYKEIQYNHYEIDTPKKLDELISALSQVNYIMLSSNRAYATVTRLPRRYPFTIEFYKMLFAGKLGFELVHTQSQYPSFAGITVNDDRSVESFTVYDHPKVLIFKKSEGFNAEAVRERLSNFPSGTHERLVEAHTQETPWLY